MPTIRDIHAREILDSRGKARPLATLLGTSLACFLIVACGKEEAAPVAVVAAPASAPAAAPAPVPGVEPALSLELQLLLEKAQVSRKCSLEFFQTSFRPSVKNVVVEKGLIGELAADAQSAASSEVAWWFKEFPPEDDVAQAERYLHALSERAWILVHSPEERMRAEMFLAYDESIATAPRCPLDAEALALIGKSA